MTWLRDEHRGAGVGDPVEQRPQVLAEHRVEADGRLVEHQQLGRAEQRDGQAGAAALPAGEVADDLVAVAAEVDGVDRAVDVVAAGAEHPGEEAEVLGRR